MTIRFESSVNLEGSKTAYPLKNDGISFESSVNLEGSKTAIMIIGENTPFESSVNPEGSKTPYKRRIRTVRLRAV